jgi:SAM-dependent methyltransferase
LFCGTDRFFKPGYNANLLEQWIPALEGVDAKLQVGGKVADVGCGYGSSTILMAKHYPNSVIHGFDFHEPSIVAARESAEKEGVSNVEFFVSDAASMPDDGYDLACIFDALHDMGDPVGATSSICGRSNRTEPSWWSSLWLGTASRTIGTCWPVCFTASQPWCMFPPSKSKNVGLALGAQAGQKRLTEVLNQAGFSNVRRATETPTNMVLKARL